MQISAIMKVG